MEPPDPFSLVDLRDFLAQVERLALARDPGLAPLFAAARAGFRTRAELAAKAGFSPRTLMRRLAQIRSYPEVARLWREAHDGGSERSRE